MVNYFWQGYQDNSQGERIVSSMNITRTFGCAVLCLVTQSCPTLCELMDCSAHGLQVHIALMDFYPWEFSRPEYWSRLPCPPPKNLPNPGIEPRSPTLQVDSLLSEPPGKPWNIEIFMILYFTLRSVIWVNFCVWCEVEVQIHSFTYGYPTVWASLVAQLVKNLPAMQEAMVQFLGPEDPPGKG